jgi:hypothetical protein
MLLSLGYGRNGKVSTLAPICYHDSKAALVVFDVAVEMPVTDPGDWVELSHDLCGDSN